MPSSKSRFARRRDFSPGVGSIDGPAPGVTIGDNVGLANLEIAVIGATARRLGDTSITVRDTEGNEATFIGAFFAEYQDLAQANEFNVASYSPAVQCGIADVADVLLTSGRTAVEVAGKPYILNYTKRPGHQDLVLILHEAVDDD